MSRKIFISYSSQNRDVVSELVDTIEQMGHEVWFGTHLSGGQRWWDVILREIRECDVFLFAMSPAAMESGLCKAERVYARALKKFILPLKMQPMNMFGDIASIQVITYLPETPGRVEKLREALDNAPSSRPLPDPLPKKPDVPIQRLDQIAQIVSAPRLPENHGDVMRIFWDLKTLLEDPKQAYDAQRLLRKLHKHPDLRVPTMREIDQISAQLGINIADLPQTGELDLGIFNQTTQIGMRFTEMPVPREIKKKRKIFISHSRDNRDIVSELVDTLEHHGYQVWWDVNLRPGHKWWRVILHEIRGCDVFLFAVTKDSMKSDPCTAERKYALALNKLILPVKMEMDVGPLRDLSRIHYIEYLPDTPDRIADLIDALEMPSSANPMPDPLPPEPPAPLRSVDKIATILKEDLPHDHLEVVTLFFQLQDLLKDPKQASDARNLMRELRDHPRLLRITAERISELIAKFEIDLADPKPDIHTRTMSVTRPPSSIYERARTTRDPLEMASIIKTLVTRLNNPKEADKARSALIQLRKRHGLPTAARQEIDAVFQDHITSIGDQLSDRNLLMEHAETMRVYWEIRSFMNISSLNESAGAILRTLYEHPKLLPSARREIKIVSDSAKIDLSSLPVLAPAPTTSITSPLPSKQDVFVSYSRQDKAYTAELVQAFEQNRLSVWIDDRIEHGDNWFKHIEDAIRDCTVFVVVMSPAAETSSWVHREILLAQRYRKPIFPVLLDGEEFAILIHLHYADCRSGKMPGPSYFRQVQRAVNQT